MYPELRQLCNKIELILKNTSCSHAAYFGSIAKNSTHSQSDIDLIICGDMDKAIRFLKELDVKLPFSKVEEFPNRSPAGRYWFKNYPPYLKLDFSFHSLDEYKIILDQGNGCVTGPFKILW